MGIYDTYCVICGCSSIWCKNELTNYLTGEIYDETFNKMKNKKNIKEFIKKTKWMEKNSILLSDNNIKHNLSSDDLNGELKTKNNKLKYSNCEIHYLDNNYACEKTSNQFNEDGFGIFIHTYCYKLIEKEFNIKLKFSDINNIKINYGIITKYQGQFFDYGKLLNDNNEKLCYEPNKKYIKNILNQFKIKPNRKGPSVSALLYNNGTIKIGNDNYLWIVNNKKWVKINKKIKYIKKNLNNKEIKNIPYIGYKNIIPLFKKKKINKNNYLLITI